MTPESALENIGFDNSEADKMISDLNDPASSFVTGRKAALLLGRMARENGRLKAHSIELQRAAQAQAIRIAELEAHCVRLGQGGAERYWEGRWRDDAAALERMTRENERLTEEARIDAETIANHAARIRELEADLKQH